MLGPLKRMLRWPLSTDLHCAPFFYAIPPTTADTIVFVHGLHGHFEQTWKQFPELLHTDPDLPRIDLLLWGYESRIWADVNSVSSEAKRLMSDLRVYLPHAKNIFLVGHSMGGLAILQGLVNEMRDSRARELPVNAIRHVLLFATPTLGSELAAVFKLIASRVPFIRRLITRQVHDLCPSTFCAELVGEIANRIYHPRIRPGDENSKRCIPITACIGTRDEVVKEGSAQSIFYDVPPIRLDCDHFSIKEPESRSDARYLALKNVLAEHYGHWLRTEAALALNAGNREGRIAAQKIKTRLAHSMDARLRACSTLAFDQLSNADQNSLRIRFLSMIIRCANEMPDARIEHVLTAALCELA